MPPSNKNEADLLREQPRNQRNNGPTVFEYAKIYFMPYSLRRFKADIFQALGYPTRIAILEHLSDGEFSAGTLIEKLGMEQANVSQHLGVLRAKQIRLNRRAGNQVFYSVRDRTIVEVLNLIAPTSIPIQRISGNVGRNGKTPRNPSLNFSERRLLPSFLLLSGFPARFSVCTVTQPRSFRTTSLPA